MKNSEINRFPAGILLQRIFTYLVAGILFYITLENGIRGLRYFIKFPEGERVAYLLLPHIATGFIALITGPFLLWLGVQKKYPLLHRRFGKVYLISVGISSVLGLYLALQRTNLLFSTGITGLALAWMVTALLAYLTIRKRLIQEHRDWMILNYVLTWAFVNFRLGARYMSRLGYTPDETMIMAWLCWVPPFLIVGLLLYLRRSNLLTKHHPSAFKQKHLIRLEDLKLQKN